ncbi:hypothetical protein [Xanthomonas theicola]|uniref:hypothetical protein n=1 Tax=Xanthomonas theicola TaxID=56464 RepID=UPI000FF883B7|nr:hypothetical protein [Xanthomonas theicola]QNH26559.1 hypothetical protein G4Q83_20075 [Xanthomonas theicola]
MDMVKSNGMNQGFMYGLAMILIIPNIIFLLSIMGGHELINSIFFDRALKTNFPKSASLFILFGLFSLLISLVPLTFGTLRISLDRLAIFKDTAMLSIHKDGRPYKLGPLIAVIFFLLVIIVMFVFGPVDMALMCYSGFCISKDPLLFIAAQNLLLFVAYICSGCVIFWIVAYIKLRRL